MKRVAGLAAAAGLFLAGAVAAGAAKKAAPPPADNGCAVCVERRPILDPKLFGKGYEPEAAMGYRIAREIPATLDLLHCFCECKESLVFRHRTLLTCFTDNHAAGCGICLREALMAADLKKQGVPDSQIEGIIESGFKTDGHAPTQGRAK